jgi:hypothetical protein
MAQQGQFLDRHRRARPPSCFIVVGSGFADGAGQAQAPSDEILWARSGFLVGSGATYRYAAILEDDMSDENTQMEALYDQAADIADKHLVAALEEGGALGYLVGVMMVEASVNAAAEATSREDIVRLLKDLAAQIEQDIKDNPGE